MRVRVKSRSTGPVSQDPPSVQVRTLFVVLDVLGQLDALVGDCRTEHPQVLDVECFLEHASDTHHQNISKPGQSRPKQAKASQSKPKQAKAGQTAMCGLVCGPRPSSCRLHFRQSARSRPFPHRPRGLRQCLRDFTHRFVLGAREPRVLDVLDNRVHLVLELVALRQAAVDRMVGLVLGHLGVVAVDHEGKHHTRTHTHTRKRQWTPGHASFFVLAPIRSKERTGTLARSCP